MTKYPETKKLAAAALISGDELRDILESAADEMEKAEPYARNSIEPLREAAQDIYDILEGYDE